MPKMDRGRLGTGNVNATTTVVREATKGGLRKMRCPVSHGIAVPTTRADGTRVLRAPNGTEYIVRKF